MGAVCDSREMTILAAKVKMKVAFIQKCSYEKISIHYLVGALRDANIEYQVFIEDLEKDFYGELVKYNPSFVAYSLFIEEESFAFEYFRRVKELIPHAKTLVGGVFTLLFPEICRKKEVDFVFRGDGEFSLPRFIRMMEAKKDVREIDGICFVDEDGQEYRNDNLGLVQLSSLPKPDRDVYYKYEALRTKSTKIFIASRGCPYQCTFCYNAEFSGFFETKYWRQRNVQDVIEEIRYVKDTYGLKWVHFQDGTFNANKVWLKSFLQAYIEANLPEFLCNARAETMDEETTSLLKKAGCNRITFGIQSGNPRIRREVAGRLTTNEQIIKACHICKKYGIRVGVDVIFGWPGETLEEALDTIRLCRVVDVETCSSNVLVFYPGLSVTRFAYENNYIEKIPTLTEIKSLDLNKSLLIGVQKNLLVNIDKLFYYMIKFPAFERLFLRLLKLPPNKLFLLLKNMHLLLRSLKYDDAPSKFRIVCDYIATSCKAANKLSG